MIHYECTSPVRLLDAPSMYRVVVVDDVSCPVCTFADTADANITIEASFPYLPDDDLPSCTDNCGFSADTKCNVETAPGALVSSDVDVEKIGTYHVTYSAVALRAENQCDSTHLVRTVHVIDTMKPMISLHLAPKAGGSATTYTTFGDGGSSSVSHNPPTRNSAADHYMVYMTSANSWMFVGVASIAAVVALAATSATTKTEVPV